MSPQENLPSDWPAGLSREARAEWISAWLDGEVSETHARALRRFLDTDARALREVEHLRRVDDLLEQYEVPVVPDAFAQSVLAAAGVERRTDGAGRVHSLDAARRPLFVAGLLATAAALMIAFGVALRSGPEAPGEDAATQPNDAVAVLETLPESFFEDADTFVKYTDLQDDAVEAELVGFEDLLAQGG
jgi:anti-sigma factor RsiW